METEVIKRKLDSLARCVNRLESKRPASVEQLLVNVDLQDIISINLERAVQVCVDIGAHVITDLSVQPPISMGSVFDLLVEKQLISAELGMRMRKAVGFRNLSVHSYDKVDWERVYDIIHSHLGNFREFAAAVARVISQPPSEPS